MNAEVRLYNHLFTQENPGVNGDVLDDLNPDSLEVLENCRLEPALADVSPGQALQFERQGYFCADADSTSQAQIFNRTISLRDVWAKIKKQKS